MKTILLFLSITLLAVSTTRATSFMAVEKECPVCGHEFYSQELASYSTGSGEPEQDLSDWPLFAFTRADVCPKDLYATLRSSGKKLAPEERDRIAALLKTPAFSLTPGEKKIVAAHENEIPGSFGEKPTDEERARLAVFLKDPAILLTPEEKKIVAGHESEVPASPFADLLWVRSCDSARDPDPRRKWLLAMKLYYKTRFFGTPLTGIPVPGWQMELAREFREQAIRELAEGAKAEWTTPFEKYWFLYLQGELLRQAGHKAKAREVFFHLTFYFQPLEVTLVASNFPMEKRNWISQCTREQMRRIDISGQSLDELISTLLPPASLPGRNQTGAVQPDWVAHRVAMEELQFRAVSGDIAASDALWNWLGRDRDRLAALFQSGSRDDFYELRKVDPKWREWFDELRKTENPPTLPANSEGDTEVVLDLSDGVLGRVIPEKFGKEWRQETLLPAVRKAAEGNKLPEVGRHGSALAGSLAELLDSSAPEDQTAAAKALVHVFRGMPLDLDDLDFPSNKALRSLSRWQGDRKILAGEMKKEWHCVFWKAACETALQYPKAANRLVSMPDGGKIGKKQQGPMREIVMDLFTIHRVPLLKRSAAATLRKDDWTDSRAEAYALALDDPDLIKLLEARAEKIHKLPRDFPNVELRQSDALHIESGIAMARVRKLPVR